jgi:hypothetical protein
MLAKGRVRDEIEALSEMMEVPRAASRDGSPRHGVRTLDACQRLDHPFRMREVDVFGVHGQIWFS